MSTTVSTPTLSEAARHLIYPSGIERSVYPHLEPTLREMGVSYDPWQRGLSTISLGLDAGGKYASTVGGVSASIPRQVGKTFTIGSLVVALCIKFPGTRVIWTAHRTRTTTNTFRSMQSFVKRAKIAPYLAEGGGIRTANGEQEITFRNGSLILFGAREQGFGRGFDEIDFLVFDEAQILTIKALEDMVAATNQARHPHGALIFFIGTPPRPSDPGEMFTAKRKKALDGGLKNGVYVELSAEDDADLDDPKQWANANPSYPTRTPHESMLRLRENLPDDASWRREALGIWDKIDLHEHPLDPFKWAARAESPTIPEGAPDYFSLSISPERIGFIGVAFRGEDVDFVDLAEAGRVDDSRRIVEWFAERRKGNPRLTVAIDTRDPAAALVNDLRAARIKVNVTTLSDSVKACMGLADAVEDEQIEHVDQPTVREALLVARKKPIGKAGQWEFDPDDDIAALRAITLARYGLTFKKKRTGEGRRTSNRRAVVVR